MTGAIGLDVREIGSFHVGGGEVRLRGLPPLRQSLTRGMAPTEFPQDGEFETGQMYVQYVRLMNPKRTLPLLLWHGGGHTGTVYETTPDGRPGWQSFFLHAGFDVYVSDAVERGRASWSRYPEVYAGPPSFRSKAESWHIFRMGPPEGWSPDPAARRPFPGTRFPMDAYDQFMKGTVPRWATNDGATQAAYDALIRKVGPCVVFAHSQGGQFGYNAALRHPDLVRAVVLLEPSGAPDPALSDAAAARGVPHLVVWGDFFDQCPFWDPLLAASARWRDALRAAGGRVEWLDPPPPAFPARRT